MATAAARGDWAAAPSPARRPLRGLFAVGRLYKTNALQGAARLRRPARQLSAIERSPIRWSSTSAQMIPVAVAAALRPRKKPRQHAVCADVGPNRFFWDYQVQSRAEDNHISFFVKTENLSRRQVVLLGRRRAGRRRCGSS